MVSSYQKAENNLIEDKILPLAKDDYEGLVNEIRKLQKNPDQIAEFNCMLTKVIYSGKVKKEEDIELLLKVQREYFAEETLDKNPEDVNIQRLIDELQEYKEADLYIIGYKVTGPQFVDEEIGDKPMLVFNVIYYLNVTTNQGEVYKGYVFEQNENKIWELKGFGTIEDFPVIN
jgi:hypothetical protein